VREGINPLSQADYQEVSNMKTVYMLMHKRISEVNENPEENAYETKLLGFFALEEQCKELIPHYLEQPGFKNYPEDFSIEEIEANVDDYNETPGEFEKSVFYLYHEYYDGTYDYLSQLGYYADEDSAQKALSLYQLEPEYLEYPDGFCIYEYEIGKSEWNEGFVSWSEMP
jgi:hypothetical protein